MGLLKTILKFFYCKCTSNCTVGKGEDYCDTDFVRRMTSFGLYSIEQGEKTKIYNLLKKCKLKTQHAGMKLRHVGVPGLDGEVA